MLPREALQQSASPFHIAMGRKIGTAVGAVGALLEFSAKQFQETIFETSTGSREFSQAKKLRGMMDNFLGQEHSKYFTFDDKSYFHETRKRNGGVSGSLLASDDWPDPLKYRINEIKAFMHKSTENDEYTIRVVDDNHDGVYVTLRGNDVKIEKLVQGNSTDAEGGDTGSPRYVPTRVSFKDKRFGSNRKRIMYGMFLVTRIKGVSEGKEILS